MSYIRVYDSVGFGSVLNNISGTSLVVRSVADMVTKVLLATQGQRYKSELFLMGGGEFNYQSVGAGSHIESTGSRSLQTAMTGELIGEARTMLPQLSERISTIHLMGIDDENCRSSSLLNAVARALGRGGRAVSNNSTVIFYGNNSTPVRHLGRQAFAQN